MATDFPSSNPHTSPTIDIFPIVNEQKHQVGVFLSGANPVHILWPYCVQKQLYTTFKAQVAFPHLFLLTTGLLCAIIYHAESIKDSHFTCFTDSYLLTMIMRKGHDKRCRKTSAVIEAITVSLAHLDALSFFHAYPMQLSSSRHSCPNHTLA